MAVNKFNMNWQLVRVNARNIKDPRDKITHVMNHLDKNKNIHNYERVKNWVKMTGVAYSGKNRDYFEKTHNDLIKNKHKYVALEDSENNLENHTTENIKKVLKDLSKRKYNFQFKKPPKDHIEFVNNLKNELKDRGVHYD